MKIRSGWVSNSSSTSFLITNTTDHNKTMKEFAEETKYLVDKYKKKYKFAVDTISVEEYLTDAEEEYDFVWKPKETIECIFGDEEGNTMGAVLDYMLRDADETESFNWKFNKYYR